MEPLRPPVLPELSYLVRQLLEQDPDLAVGLRRLNLAEPDLVTLAMPHGDRILRGATPEIDQLAIAESQLHAAERQMATGVRLHLSSGRPVRLALLIGGLVVGAVALMDALGVTDALGVDFPNVLPKLGGALVMAIMGTGAAVWWSRRRRGSASKDRWRAEIDLHRNRVHTARAAVVTALVDRGLRPIVLQLRAERDNPAYTTRLQYVSARGLSQIFDPTLLEVETPAVRRVRGFLDGTPGGSIGLAGPRGTGKSTLLASFVDGRSRRSDNRRARAIQVSAPVEYDPRDFILHVFATLCESVMVPRPPTAAPAARPGGQSPPWSGSGRNGGSAPVAGALVCIVAGVLLLLPTFGMPDVDWRKWGGYGLLVGGVLLVVLLAADRWLAASRSASRAATASLVQPLEGVAPATALLAAEYLELIRYQRTYTSGWSGSAKAGFAAFEVGAGVTGSVARVATGWSLPEIVSSFKDFVTTLAATEPVIIGVDELDKIATAERAHDFLNDIKSLFGVEQCYFLISISEDALSSFERRGLPLRDAFDSALDDVVPVRPLDYPTARKLIRQRVIGLSNPHTALVYCLGAGLPRDIIRWTRALVQSGKVGDRLEALTRHLVGEDLQRKVFASTVALSRHPAPAAADMEFVGGLVPVAEPAWLLDCISSRQISAPTVRDGHEPVIDGLLAYFYFCATVLEVFLDDITESEFAAFTSPDRPLDGVEQLTFARQSFSSGPAVAVGQITAFRRRRGLSCPNPAPTGPAGSAAIAAAA